MSSQTKRFFPLSGKREGQSVVTAKVGETARFDVPCENKCPTCGTDMVIVTANGHRAWVCERDRHCFPVKDSQ